MRTAPSLVALGLVAAGCFASDPEPVELEDDDALALVASVEAEDYTQWEPPPTSADLPRRRLAAGPHGAWVEVYLHPDLLAAFFGEEPIEAWPAGVAAVCESYASEDDDAAFLINVMRRDDDGWSWAQVDADGQPLTGARPDDCIGCHGAAEDFVFSLFLPRE